MHGWTSNLRSSSVYVYLNIRSSSVYVYRLNYVYFTEIEIYFKILKFQNKSNTDICYINV